MTVRLVDIPVDSERIPQEFYCNECDGYFLANLNVHLNIKVTVICPNCGHNHNRVIKNGVILESFESFNRHEEIMCLKCTYQKTPYTSRMKKGARAGSPLDDRWVEKAAREKGQA